MRAGCFNLYKRMGYEGTVFYLYKKFGHKGTVLNKGLGALIYTKDEISSEGVFILCKKLVFFRTLYLANIKFLQV